MSIRSEHPIYKILERLLKEAGDDPQTCVDLYEKHSEVRKVVDDANRVSDFLGHMWRRGKLQRWYSEKADQRARFGYTWKEQKGGDEPKPAESPNNLRVIHGNFTRAKPNVTITEEDSRIVLDFGDIRFTIERKVSS